MNSNTSEKPQAPIRLNSSTATRDARSPSRTRSTTRTNSTTNAPSSAPLAPPSPHNMDAEQSVLGAMLMEVAALKYARQALTEADFYKTGHGLIFSELLAVADSGQPVDMITVVEHMRRHDTLDQIFGEGNGPAYLTNLLESCPSAANAPAYVAIVRDLSLKRRAAVLANQAHGYALNGVAAGVSLVELRRTLEELSASEREGHAPATLSAADLMEMELPEPCWVVPGILPEGLGILAGNPKLGKSWLALNICLAVACGGAALGQIAVEPGDVLYLALEDTKRRLQSRLRKMLPQGQKAPARLHLATEWERVDEGGIARLEQWLEEHPSARLIVIDTLQKVRTARARGGDLYADDYAGVSNLKAIADRFGVGVVVIHHRRKGQGDDDLEAVSGTYGLTGAADSILSLKRERGRQDATLYVTGRDIDEQELALRWDGDIGSWSLLGEAAEYRLSEERASVMQTLRQAGRALSPKDVFDSGVGSNAEAVRVLLYKMASDGQIKNDGGRYSPIPAALLPTSGTNGTTGTSGTSGTSGTVRSREASVRAQSEPYQAQISARPNTPPEAQAQAVPFVPDVPATGTDVFDDDA